MGGGGGGSGRVGYAGYIEIGHELLMFGSAEGLTFSTDLVTALETMLANNPYTTHTAYNPDTALAAMVTALSAFSDVSDDLIDESLIDAEVEVFNVNSTYRLETEVVPKFNTLMRDIGAVQSSTYVIGQASLLAAKSRDVNTYEAEVRGTWKKIYIQSQSELMTAGIEIERMRIASKHDEEQRDAEIDKLSVSWKVDTLVKGGQFLGILGGGTMVPDGANKVQSAVSGGLAGAAAGAYIGATWGAAGGPIGVAGGAAIGGLLGAGSAFL